MAIRYRNGAYEVVIHVAKIGEKRTRISRSVRMAQQKRIPREVKEVEARLIAEVGAGKHRADHLTVDQLLDAYLVRAEPDLSPTTFKGYEGAAQNYLRPTLGSRKVAHLTTVDLDRLYADLLRKGYSPSTIRGAHSVIRRALRYAERQGWATSNAAAIADVPSVDRRPVEAATREQVETLIACPDEDLADLIALAAGTGMRRGEMCGLRWSDVDFSGGSCVIARAVVDPRGKVSVKLPKSGRVRRITLGPKLLARLKARRARMAERAERFGTTLADGYVLSPSVDGSAPLAPNVASDRFRVLAKKLELPVHLHMLRHYAATEAISNGHDVNAVAAHMGHTSAKMTLDVYGHARPARVEDVGNILDVG